MVFEMMQSIQCITMQQYRMCHPMHAG